jgi:hypothetical protein
MSLQRLAFTASRRAATSMIAKRAFTTTFVRSELIHLRCTSHGIMTPTLRRQVIPANQETDFFSHSRRRTNAATESCREQAAKAIR